jgi:hypothetical protein
MRKGSRKEKGELERRRRTGMRKASRKDEVEYERGKRATISDLLHVTQILHQE